MTLELSGFTSNRAGGAAKKIMLGTMRRFFFIGLKKELKMFAFVVNGVYEHKVHS